MSDRKSYRDGYAYQGVNVFCACCGQPCGDSPFEDEGEYKSEEEGKLFYYCSIECRERH